MPPTHERPPFPHRRVYVLALFLGLSLTNIVRLLNIVLTNAILQTLRPHMDCGCCSWAWDTDATLVMGLKGASVTQRSWSQSSWRERASGTGDWREN